MIVLKNGENTLKVLKNKTIKTKPSIMKMISNTSDVEYDITPTIDEKDNYYLLTTEEIEDLRLKTDNFDKDIYTLIVTDDLGVIYYKNFCFYDSYKIDVNNIDNDNNDLKFKSIEL